MGFEIGGGGFLVGSSRTGLGSHGPWVVGFGSTLNPKPI